MRHLLQSQVLKSASLAALASTAACYPRLSLWSNRAIPVWYLAASVFVCGVILWGFVFAWHRRYAGLPIFWVRWNTKLFTGATLAGIGLATCCHLWLDPALRGKMPDEFPADLEHWLASLLFLLGFGQLFLTFAGFDWSMRLCRNHWVAMTLTALFGVGVVAMKIHAHAADLSPMLLASLFVGRFIGGLLAVWFYLRGGMLLAWWLALLLEARLLPDLI